MSGLSPEELRCRLVEIDDDLRGLPSDDFAGKYRLNTEGDQHRKLLAAALATELRAASDDWAERAARKASHSVTDEELAAEVTVANHLRKSNGIVAGKFRGHAANLDDSHPVFRTAEGHPASR